MVHQKLSSQRIAEVQQVLAAYTPTIPGTDLTLLGALSRAVLTSVDVRDLRRTSSEELVAQFESLLATIRRRPHGEIAVGVRRDGDKVVIESSIEDQPFLVSSVRAWLGAEGIRSFNLINAVVRLRRDASGSVTAVGSGQTESIIRIELEHEGDAAALVERYRQRLRVAQAMVRDFQPMKRRLQDLADDYLRAAVAVGGERALMLRETEGMIRWLCEENYVLLGVEAYQADGQMISALSLIHI